MPAGGNSSGSLRIFGEEKKELCEHKQFNKDLTTLVLSMSMYNNYDNKKPSSTDPKVVISDSTSLATVPSIDPVSKTIENINVSGPKTAAAADCVSDSEDSRINSDKQLLLDN